MSEVTDPRAQFRELPDPVLPAEAVETVDTRRVPEHDLRADEERFLHNAG
ncbi:hypothetical protein [Modestobacter versicolor]|uniref:Uncharacterized protein n=1 Tax=Modestobacter versicolor TaxID=429133 RepID=A0A839Y3F3_9ACTN|nr:hypothetical protein [Modestobacter versicolor]MBB3675892.1 hypothetical protein [Modestobacter versicolor]